MSRNLIIAGRGVRLAGQMSEFHAFLENSCLPCVLTWGGADLLPTDHPQNIGIIGVCGQRGANKALAEHENAIVLGTTLSITATGIHKVEQQDGELREFFAQELKHPSALGENWAANYRMLDGDFIQDARFTSYKFNRLMTSMLPSNANIVVDGGGTTLYTGFQSSIIKEGTRLICATAISAMGSGLPEAVGACMANGNLTSCLIGDGSFMLNLQELQTIKHHNLPIKIFVINNGGYLAIRDTQDQYLEGRHFGTSEAYVSLPETRKVAAAFNLPYTAIRDEAEANASLPLVLSHAGPAIVEVFTPHNQKTLMAIPGKPLSEMSPAWS